MARIGIIFGLLLCGLTIGGMSATTQKSYTQFVPMMFGIPMLFLGVVSLNPHRRAGSIFVAFVLAVLAMALGGGRLLVLALDRARGQYVNPISLRLVIMMTVLSLVFALIAWMWHRRRTRDAALVSETLRNMPNPEPSPEAKTAVPRPSFHENPYQTPAILDEREPRNPSDSAETVPPVTPRAPIQVGDSASSDLPPSDLSRFKS